MKTNGKWTVEYIRSNELQDIFLIIGPNTHRYEYRERDTCEEQDILDSLPD